MPYTIKQLNIIPCNDPKMTSDPVKNIQIKSWNTNEKSELLTVMFVVGDASHGEEPSHHDETELKDMLEEF
jgi:hypothetical protein